MYMVAQNWNQQVAIVEANGACYNIPTMQFFTGISRNTQSKSSMLSLTECVWNFQNDAFWDTINMPSFSLFATILL